MSEILIEACVDSCATALAAQHAGADRLEVNCALELDGLTPSAGLWHRVMESVRIPVIAMARPRAGDFQYSDDEWDTLLQDARWLLEHGASGVAFGCLTGEGLLDRERCDQMRQLSGSAELVFHKAFDAVPTEDWQACLDGLIDCGVNRVMSSGHQRLAIDGCGLLADMQERAAGRIEILPAGGVRHDNVRQIVSKTGCRQVHGSFRSATEGDFLAGLATEIQAVRSELTKD